MARPRKYTAEKLRRAVAAYFRERSRTVTLQERVSTGERDACGCQVYALRDVLNDDGEPVRVLEYVIPPTVGGLCRSLGIHRSTWAAYRDHEKCPELAEIADQARDAILGYLEHELLTRPGNELDGIIFQLRVNYGYGEQMVGKHEPADAGSFVVRFEPAGEPEE